MKINIYTEKAKKGFDTLKNNALVYLNKSATITLRKKNHTIYPVKLALVTIAVILIISVILSVVMGSGIKSVQLSFEAGSIYSVCSAGDDIVVYNNKGAKLINENGKIKWSVDAALSEPMADVSGDYTLLCDLAGNHYAASYKNGNKNLEYKLSNDIISAKVTSKGYVAFATDTDGYKGKVTVFNKRGRELYVWNSGGGYLTDVDLTENGRYIAAAQLSGDGEEVSAKLRFIDTRRGETVATVERNGEIAVNVKFLSDNKLIMVTDSNILGYNRRGKELFCISLKGKSPSEYNIDGDKLISVVTMDNRGNSVLELYNYSGKFCGSYTSVGGIHCMTTGGNRAVVAEQRGLVSINSKGKVKSISSVEHDITAIGGFKSGSSVLIMGSTKAEVAGIK